MRNIEECNSSPSRIINALGALSLKDTHDSVPKEFKVDLQTHIISPLDKHIPVYARCEWIDSLSLVDETEHGPIKIKLADKYIAYLSSFNGPIVGDMTFIIYRSNYYKSTESSKQPSNYYIDKNGNTLPHIKIEYMKNRTENSESARYTHVGNALHECAFRVSLMHGCHGRIMLEATRDTHYFHFKNGFRQYHKPDYYFELAKLLFASGGKRITRDLGNKYLYLTKDAILKNLLTFKISHKLEEFETETKHQKRIIESGAVLMKDAEDKTLAFQVIHALGEPYGKRLDMPLHSTCQHKTIKPKAYSLPCSICYEAQRRYKENNPSLFCSNTRMIIDVSIELIKELIPINSAEKEKRLSVILAGTMIIVYTFQDKIYGKQNNRYSTYPLYPHGEYDAISNFEASIESNIETIGEGAMVTKNLLFSMVINAEFFPALAAVPGLGALLYRQSMDVGQPVNLESHLKLPS